jgi:Mor family transcriptional regulator
VWSDSDYDSAETKAERLLLAALDYSMERHVIYIAAKPPRSVFRQLAARVNRQIVYVPLGQLSPAKLKKIRVVHVLDGYHRREEARQYIW